MYYKEYKFKQLSSELIAECTKSQSLYLQKPVLRAFPISCCSNAGDSLYNCLGVVFVTGEIQFYNYTTR